MEYYGALSSPLALLVYVGFHVLLLFKTDVMRRVFTFTLKGFYFDEIPTRTN